MVTKPESVTNQSGIRTAVLLGLFTGTGVGVGYLMSGVPNIELMTLISALAGGVLGPRLGFVTGSLSEIVYSLGSPFGAPVPLLLLAQALGMGLAGLLGGLWAGLVTGCARRRRLVPMVAASVVLGLVATLAFDLLTNLSLAVAFRSNVRLVMRPALPFALLHLEGNVPLFAVLYPTLLVRLVRLTRSSLRGVPGPPAVVFLLLLWEGVHATAAVAPLAPVVRRDAFPVEKAGASFRGATGGRLPVASTGDDSTRAWPAARQAIPDTTGAVAPIGPAAVDSSLNRGVAGGGTRGPTPPAGKAGAGTAATALARSPRGYGRPLWRPFAANLPDLLAWETPLVVIADGGFGSEMMLLGEPGTAAAPLLIQDGIPLQTGHRWADDPWTWTVTGLELEGTLAGLDGFGGSGGAVIMRAAEPDSQQTITDTRFYKGDHETFLRSLAFSSPQAPLRLRFDFEESLDQQGYDFRVPGDLRFGGLARLGESKFRSGRGTLGRSLGRTARVSLSVQKVRKHKTGLAAAGLDHQEIWADHAVFTWQDRSLLGGLRLALAWNGSDVQHDFARKLEVLNQMAILELGRTEGRQLRLQVNAWSLDDTGADSSWARQDAGPVHAVGQQILVSAASCWQLGPLPGRVELRNWWDDWAGWQVGGSLRVGSQQPGAHWAVTLESGGRAPRRDELLTADRVFSPQRSWVLLPNRDLGNEYTLRAAGLVSSTLWGTDLAVMASVRRLSDGITWIPQLEPEGVGQWRNDLRMDSHTLTVRLERGMPLWGWLRLRAEAVWRGERVHSAAPAFLPPDRSSSLEALWEKRFFQEDLVLELGYWLEHRGEMGDPWVPDRSWLLPALTRHDAILAIRLVGVDLSLQLVNITDQRLRLSSGALSSGRELRWRMHWTFRQ